MKKNNNKEKRAFKKAIEDHFGAIKKTMQTLDDQMIECLAVSEERFTKLCNLYNDSLSAEEIQRIITNYHNGLK